MTTLNDEPQEANFDEDEPAPVEMTDDEPVTQPVTPEVLAAEVKQASSDAVQPLIARTMKETNLESRVTSLATELSAMKVTDAPSYTAVGERLILVKAMRKEITATFKPIIDAQQIAIDITRQQRDRHDKPLADVEASAKTELINYDNEQERLAREAARIENARIEEEARNRRLDDAAEAETDGRTDDAADIMNTPINAAPAIVQKATPKVGGLSFKLDYYGEVSDLAKLLLAAAAELQDPDKKKPRVHWALFNQKQVIEALTSRANQYAKSNKLNVTIDGVRQWSNKGASARS